MAATATSPTDARRRLLVLEATTLSGGRVDVAAGVIRGARVLGASSRNRRRYPADVLTRCHGLYEAAPVYTDHDYTGRTRPMNQLAGKLANVSCREGSIWADIHCLKETSAGKIVLEAAEKMPAKFGLSPMHLIDVVTGADGTETVREIVEVRSVDAVTNPATTKGLFEEVQPMPDEPAAAAAPPALSLEDWFALGTATVMNSPDFDDSEKLQMTKDIFKLKSKFLGTEEEPEAPAEGEPPSEGESVRAPGQPPSEASAAHPRPRSVRSVLAALEEQVARTACRQMLAEAGLASDPATLNQLLGLPTDEARAGFVGQLRRTRRRPYGGGTPRSGGRAVGEAYEGGAAPRPASNIPRLSRGASADEVRRWLHS